MSPSQPPAAIRLAIRCFWVGLVLDLCESLMPFVDPSQYEAFTQLSGYLGGYDLIKPLAILGIGFAAVWIFSWYLLIRGVRLRKKRARFWFVITYFCSTLFCAPTLLGLSSVHTFLDAIDVLITAASLGVGYYALYLLYASSGKLWFSKDKIMAL